MFLILPTSRMICMRKKIIDAAERLLQEKGYHGWSYSDVEKEVGIRKASIHYYFPKKEDLGLELIRHYRCKADAAVQSIDREINTPFEKLMALALQYGQVLTRGNAYCLAGMMTADLLTLPHMMKVELADFFHSQELWLKKTLDEGISKNGWSIADSQVESELLMASLQGFLLLSRLKSEPFQFYNKQVNDFLKSRYK